MHGRLAIALLATFAGVVVAVSGFAAETEQKDIVLDNGTRITVVHVPGAARQSTFTLLPLSLINDDAGRAQFSHLVEHMMIRSTDPDGLEVDGIRINGETTAGSLRLETIAPPEKWREALDRHGKWLAAREFDGEVLEREKGRIEGEEQSTITRGFTGKWAEAAWNQVVRHGLEHAAAHGDVAGATVDMVTDYVAARVRTGSSVRVVMVGPVALEDILDAAREVFADLPAMKPASTKPTKSVESIRAVGDREATWDLPVYHYLEWYPVPGATGEERLLAYAAAMTVSMRLWREPRLKELGFFGTGGELTSPEGRWIVFSGSVSSADAVLEVQEILRKCIDSVDLGIANMTLMQLRNQFGALPDFAQLKAAMGERRGTELIEAQVILNLVMREQALDMHRSKFPRAFQAATGEQVMATIRESLKAERRSTLLLGPEGK